MNKLGSYDKKILNTLNIKSEIDIKEEPLKLDEKYLAKYDMKLESGNHQKEASEISTDGFHLEKPCGSSFGKIKVKHDESFDEVYDALIEDDDMKTEIDVKNEDIEDLFEDQSGNLNNDVILKGDSDAKKKGIRNESKGTKNIFDSPTPDSSRHESGTPNFTGLQNEERKEEENKIKDFESRKRIKLNDKFKCSLCEYKTNLKGNLKLHSLVHSTVKLFKCSECDYQCNHKSSLKIHLLSHSNKNTKLFKCSECGFECNYKFSLKNHLLKHSGMNLFKCSECNYECNRKDDLKIHLLKHASTKLFKCSECDFECNQKGHLKVHLLSHSNTKLFKCSDCDYECNHKGNMKIHLLSHSKTKLFKCPECDYTCNYKRNFKLHSLTHSNKNTKLFKCSECDYGCNEKRRLKKHLLSHSNI